VKKMAEKLSENKSLFSEYRHKNAGNEGQSQ
jgi:hypothetical protein